MPDDFKVTFPSTPASSLLPQSWGFGSGYDAANSSTRRGQINWSTLETSEELGEWDRAELLGASRWLKANVGLIKGLVKNSAMFIGWKTAHAQTTDTEWNKDRDKSFQARNKSKIVFDSAGKFNIRTGQKMMVERALGDADILVVFTETPSGGARCAFYEAHQLKNPKTKNKRWKEGVLVSKTGAHLAYGVKDGDKVKVISARDAYLFGAFESIGHVRPHLPLSHAITNAVDITETRGYLKLALKNSSLFGVVEELDSGANPARGSVGGVATTPLPGAPATKQVEEDKKIKTAEVWDGAQAPELRPGSKLKTISDERPHQNHMDFDEVVIRDIALGWGLPFEVVYSMYKLTGPGVRFVMAVAEKWIEQWQEELDNFVHRYWVYDTAKEIKAGRLREPDDPDWMQNLKLTKRRSMTIDRGKEGKQRLDEIASGAGTLADWCEEVAGDDWRDHLDQVGEEFAYKKATAEKHGATMAEMFPPRQGAAKVETDSDDEPDQPDSADE